MEDAAYRGRGQSAKNAINYVTPLPILLEVTQVKCIVSIANLQTDKCFLHQNFQRSSNLNQLLAFACPVASGPAATSCRCYSSSLGLHVPFVAHTASFDYSSNCWTGGEEP